MMFSLSVLLIFKGCTTEGEVNISADVKQTTIENPDLAIPEEESPGEESSGGVSSVTNLLFEENFEYEHSNFLTDSSFTTKWDTFTFGSTHALATSNSSSSWAASGSGYWGAGLITKQTFNLPLTIEYYFENQNYGSGANFEGVCIYDSSFQSSQRRNTYYNYPVYAPETNFGCVMEVAQTKHIYLNGIFQNTDFFNSLSGSQKVIQGSPNRYEYIPSGNIGRVKKVIINIRSDLSVVVTYIDSNNNIESFTSDINNSLSDFKVEFFSSDIGSSNESHFDNIKIYSGEVISNSY